MKTVGQILSETRLKQKLELEDVSRITRIRSQFLALIEADDYQSLPSGAVAKGFIKNYCEFLGLDSTQLLAVFRRDFIETKSGQIVPRGMVDPVSHVSFWTPRTTIIAVVTFIFTIFTVYLFYQFRVLTGPPPLKISRPTAEFVTSESTIEVVGTTDPEATIAVNNQLIALDKGGRFSFRLTLEKGDNIISVVAKSKSGKTTTLTRTVLMR